MALLMRTAGFAAFVKDRFNLLDPNSHGPDRVGLGGVDVSEPEEHLAVRVEEFNRDPNAPFNLRLAVPAEFEAVISRLPDRPVFKGELNPIFQGIYSSRIELKNWMRLTERQLLNAEKLSVIAGLLGSPADPAELMASWEPVLFNETHDLASGVMTDHVYDDTVGSYAYSERRAGAIIAAKWDALTSRIDTRGPGAPVVVFNPLGWKRTDAASVDLGFGESGVTGVAITDPEGQAVPSQVVDSTRYWDGGLKTARVVFVARDIPALGYCTFHASASKGSVAGGKEPQAIPRAEAGFGRDDSRKRPLPSDDRPAKRRDDGPRVQARELAGARRPRQRRLTRRRSRRSLGALQRPGRRQPHRHDQPAKGAASGQGGLQRRRQGRAGHRDERTGCL